MGCQLEVVSFVGSAEGGTPSVAFVPECPPDCTGPEVFTEKRALLFGKWWNIDRTVRVCPVSGQEYATSLLGDLLGATDPSS